MSLPNLQFSQYLINHAAEVVRRWSKRQQATGERFNLFQILGVGHYEVSTHSALLCDLLDPQGTHGQGSVFLRHFVEMLQLDEAFDVDTAKVDPEFRIGQKEETTGGRLDIRIKGNRGMLVIENKIYAIEQENWVSRYLNYIRTDGHLLYLTLDGKSPEQMSPEQKGAVRCISYADFILRWLEACRKEVATVPIVRESLTQYIRLIQHLTHQNPDKLMSQEIATPVLESPENFMAYEALVGAESAIREAILKGLVERLKKAVASRFDGRLNMIQWPNGSGKQYDGFAFTTPALETHNLKAVISFDSGAYRECFYGFELLDPKGSMADGVRLTEILKRCFENEFQKGNSSLKWPAWIRWEQKKDWDFKVLRSIHFEKKAFDEEMLSKLEGLLAVAEAFTMALQAKSAQGSEPGAS